MPFFGVPPLRAHWKLIDQDADNVAIIANNDNVWLSRRDGSIHRWTHSDMTWERMDDNKDTVQVVPVGGKTYQRRSNGDVLRLVDGDQWEKVKGSPVQRIWAFGENLGMDSERDIVCLFDNGGRISLRNIGDKLFTGFSLANERRARQLFTQTEILGGRPPPGPVIQMEVALEYAYSLSYTGAIDQFHVPDHVPDDWERWEEIQGAVPGVVSIHASLGHVYQTRENGDVLRRGHIPQEAWNPDPWTKVDAPPDSVGLGIRGMAADGLVDAYYQILENGHVYRLLDIRRSLISQPES